MATMMDLYKKCFKCGYITSDIAASQCDCGGFLYPVSSIYVPKTKTDKKRKTEKCIGIEVPNNKI